MDFNAALEQTPSQDTGGGGDVVIKQISNCSNLEGITEGQISGNVRSQDHVFGSDFFLTTCSLETVKRFF